MSEETLLNEETPPAPGEDLAFSRSLFGYDPMEVRAFVAQMTEQVERLQAQQDSILSGNGAMDEASIGVVIDSVVGDIAEVLEAARGSYRKVRERAENEAAVMLAEAAEQVRKMLATAESDAFALRKSAWDASTEALESMKAESARLRTAAEREALEIIGDAERKAHRKLVVARRDSETAIQTASAESDRLLGLARAKGREILRAAEDRAESVNDHVSAMEKRHEELRREAEAFSAKLEGPVGGNGPSQTSTVRIIPPPEADPEEDELGGAFEIPVVGGGRGVSGSETAGRGRTVGWADGTESVRLVETPAVRARVEVDALELADEVARLNRRGGDGVNSPEGEVPQDTKGSGSGEVRLVGVAAGGPSQRLAAESPAVTAAPVGTLDDGRPDDLAALFRELRMDRAAATDDGVGDSLARSTRSPLEVYDRKLLPVANRALRAVKRRLIDIEKDQLKSLEGSLQGWAPEVSELSHPLVHVLTVMEREAFERGHTSAMELTGVRLPYPREEVEGQGIESFVAGLLEDVTKAVDDARSGGRPEGEVAKALSRVYRVWRTDEAERRLRFLAGRSYHRGLVEGLSSAGVGRYRVEVNGSCRECSALAQEVFAADGVPLVPADTDCRCIVVPA